jgi:hypothetical protein
VATWAALVGSARAVTAQPVLGAGDDATIPAPGQLRVRTSLLFGEAKERAGGVTGGGGGRVPIGSELSLDALGPRQVPGLARVRDTLRAVTGRPGLALSLGTVRVSARTNTTVVPVVVEYGVLRRVALSVVIPYVATRTLVNLEANAGDGAGNFGVNPTRGTGALATAAQNQTRDALRNLTEASAAASDRCPTATAAPGCANAAAVIAAADRLRVGLVTVYGDGTASSGAAAVPLAGSDAQAAVAQRIAELGAQFAAVGVTGFSTQAVPAASRALFAGQGVGALLNDPANGVAFSSSFSPFGSTVRSSIGEVELAASFKLFDGFGDAGRDGGLRARVAPRGGVRARSTVTGGYRFATGPISRPDLLFDLPPGERAAAVLVRSATDVAVGRRLSASVVGRFAAPVADRRLARVPLAPGEPFAPYYTYREVNRRLGREVQVEVTPRYALGEAFAVVAQALVRDRAAAAYTGTFTALAEETLGEPATLDAAALNLGTGGREARVGFGAAYSTLAAYARGRSALPWRSASCTRPRPPRPAAPCRTRPPSSSRCACTPGCSAGRRFGRAPRGLTRRRPARGLGALGRAGPRGRAPAPAGRALEQLTGVRPAHLALGVAPEHAGDLAHAGVAGEDADVGRRDAVARALAHEDVVVRARGELRQVRDGEHLVVRGHAAHRLADHQPHAAPDPGVDLVEHERGHAVEPREDGLEREHHARQLAARGRARERPGVVAEVEGDAELDILRAGRARLARAAAPRGIGRPPCPGRGTRPRPPPPAARPRRRAVASARPPPPRPGPAARPRAPRARGGRCRPSRPGRVPRAPGGPAR